VSEIAEQIGAASAIYAADYRGLSVSQAAALRSSLREADTTFRIVKNTLTLLAADKAGAEQVKQLVEGPTAFAFVHGDPALAAKVIDVFARREQVLEVRGGVIAGELVSADFFKQLARLPAREQLNAQFVVMVATPITALVRGLGSLVAGLAVALGQVRDKMPQEPAAEEAPVARPAAPEAPAAEPAPEEVLADETPEGEAPATTAGDEAQPNEKEAD